jgi:hypothetical protein
MTLQKDPHLPRHLKSGHNKGTTRKSNRGNRHHRPDILLSLNAEPTSVERETTGFCACADDR